METMIDLDSLPVTEKSKHEGDIICPSKDALVRAQLEDIKKKLEASSSDEEEGRVAQKPLFEILRECIPRGSPLVSFLFNRSETTTRSSLVSNGYAPRVVRTPQDVWDAVDKTEPQRDYVLVLRDIDSHWCEALCAKYPGAIDRMFILEHILGIDLQKSGVPFYQAPYDSREATATVRIMGQEAAKMQRMDRISRVSQQMSISVHRSELEIAAQADSLARKSHGVHVNWWRAPQSGARGSFSLDTHEEFRRTKYGWAKTNAFVSCCRLASNLYLVLTSTTPSIRVDAAIMGSDRMMCMAPNFGSRVMVCMPDHDRNNLIDDAVVDLIQQHWPVFDWKCSTETKLSAWAQSQVDGLVFASLLKETVLRMSVEREEGEVRDLAYLADTEDGAEHFKRLTGFRRVLARLHQSLGEAQSAFKTSSKEELHARGLVLLRGAKTSQSSATFMPGEAAEDSTKPQQPADFTKLHMESLQGLQERLDAIKEDLNEEIQIAIGSVQVHDAKTMKKQTTWTMVLTVLAAIYLPMTLVTGIFGMNITEISSEATAPDAWWAFGAWAVVFAVTLAGILLYAVVRKWKARNKRKRKADLEANCMSNVHTGSARKRAGGGSGKGVKRWARNLRQKTKKTWTSKRE